MTSQELIDKYNRLGKEASALINRAKIGAIITAILFLISVNANHVIGGILFFLIGGIGIVYPATTKSFQLINERKQLYKENFVTFVLTELLDNVQYIPDNGFSRNEFNNMNLVQIPEGYSTDKIFAEKHQEILPAGVNETAFHSEDYIRASYKNVWFDYSDVTSKVTHKFDNRTITEVIFDGSAIKFEIDMKKVTDLHIFSKLSHHRAKSNYSSDLINLEDIEFNEEFDVYSAKEVEAFYMLTPPFMECIKKLHHKIPTLSMRFTNNTLYVVFYTDSYIFDVSSGNFDLDRKRIATHIQSIKDIVDILQLT